MIPYGAYDFRNLPDDRWYVVTFNFSNGLSDFILPLRCKGYQVLDYLDTWYKKKFICGALIYQRGFSVKKECIEFGDIPRGFHDFFYLKFGYKLPKYTRLPYDFLT